MDANKESAEGCLEQAREFLAQGNLPRARRFAEKARHLYPSLQADAMIMRVERAERGSDHAAADPQDGARAARAGAGDAAAGNAAEADKQRERQRQRDAETETPAARSFTPEQEQQVRKILAAKDLYSCLGVARDCDEAELKRAYRRLAVVVHPDKSAAPQADEAFKRLSHAFQVLSDKERRLRYDQVGDEQEEPNRMPTMRRRTHGGMYRTANGATYFSTGELDPEELFDILFSGGSFRHRRGGPSTGSAAAAYGGHHAGMPGRGGAGATATNGIFLSLAQFFLVVLVVLFTFGSIFSSDEPVYSLQQTAKHTRERATAAGGVKYFVSRHFEREHADTPRKLMRIESNVDSEALQDYAFRCSREQEKHRELLHNSRSWFVRAAVKRRYQKLADQFKFTHCDAYSALKRKLSGNSGKGSRRAGHT
ncbi:DnaJ-like subfamily B member 12 [Porphyridium purpureum]|uniref:DnaJ-like subfamily B member 12 n=1 Tax=Porphyridium purpureum TaxID=35688 RepID=A0A5J4YXZ1_PORPP|nr:DnaJ-like subfamily B member 12 [Porphyridium purpureum]|eukprot:POR7083..scf209_3